MLAFKLFLGKLDDPIISNSMWLLSIISTRLTLIGDLLDLKRAILANLMNRCFCCLSSDFGWIGLTLKLLPSWDKPPSLFARIFWMWSSGCACCSALSPFLSTVLSPFVVSNWFLWFPLSAAAEAALILQIPHLEHSSHIVFLERDKFKYFSVVLKI